MNRPVVCKLGLVLPETLHLQMIQLAGQGRRGVLQDAYASAFEALLAALDAGEAISFAAVRGRKIRITLRLPEPLCARIRGRAVDLTLKITDFACAAVGRFLAASQGD